METIQQKIDKPPAADFSAANGNTKRPADFLSLPRTSVDVSHYMKKHRLKGSSDYRENDAAKNVVSAVLLSRSFRRKEFPTNADAVNFLTENDESLKNLLEDAAKNETWIQLQEKIFGENNIRSFTVGNLIERLPFFRNSRCENEDLESFLDDIYENLDIEHDEDFHPPAPGGSGMAHIPQFSTSKAAKKEDENK